jgi:hypothetical protein
MPTSETCKAKAGQARDSYKAASKIAAKIVNGLGRIQRSKKSPSPAVIKTLNDNFYAFIDKTQEANAKLTDTANSCFE